MALAAGHSRQLQARDCGAAACHRWPQSTFPNWIGTTQERPYTITGDVLVYKVAVVSGTGQPGETGWKRAKK